MDDSLLLQSLVSPASWVLSLLWAFVLLWHSALVSIPSPFVLHLHCCLSLCSVCQRCDPRRECRLTPCFWAGSCQQNLCSLWWDAASATAHFCGARGSSVEEGYCQILIYLFNYLRCAYGVLLRTHNVTKSGQCFHGAEGVLVKLRSSSVKIVPKHAWKF